MPHEAQSHWIRGADEGTLQEGKRAQAAIPRRSKEMAEHYVNPTSMVDEGAGRNDVESRKVGHSALSMA